MRIEQTRRLHAAGILPSPQPSENVEALAERLSALKLGFAAEAITEMLSEAIKEEQSFAAFLDSLLRLELERQEERRVTQALKISHLPTVQRGWFLKLSIRVFRWKHPPHVDS